MKISVIIPVYNTGRYLGQCLDSVAAQYFQDWECLLIDDGSTDFSGKICDRYAGSDTRFRVFHTENSGVSAARNLGIEHAKADYIAFIDSDDTVERGYLSELYEMITAGRADMAICGMKYICQDSVKPTFAKAGVFSFDNSNSDRIVDLNRKSLLYGPWIKLYRSDIIKGKNIGFPRGIHFGEDLMFNFDYLEHVATVAVSEAPNYNYRVTEGGTLSTSRHSREFRTNYEQWKIIRSFFRRKGIDTPAAGAFLSDRLWGLAYDTVMSRRLTLKRIREIFCARFIEDLHDFKSYSIAVPFWLRVAISKRLHLIIWLIQRRINYELSED